MAPLARLQISTSYQSLVAISGSHTVSATFSLAKQQGCAARLARRPLGNPTSYPPPFTSSPPSLDVDSVWVAKFIILHAPPAQPGSTSSATVHSADPAKQLDPLSRFYKGRWSVSSHPRPRLEAAFHADHKSQVHKPTAD